MRTFIVKGASAGRRLDKFVSSALSLPRSFAQDLIQQGKVTVNTQHKSRSYQLKEEDTVSIDAGEREGLFYRRYEKADRIPVLYEDEDIIVVNKPYGISVHPAGLPRGNTVVEALLSSGKQLFSGDEKRPGVVHRLDKETSGVMVFSKTKRAYMNLIDQFKKRKIKKFYAAMVEGILKQADHIIDCPLKRDMHRVNRMKVDVQGHKEARTRVRVIARFNDKNQTLVLLMPLTGRTHQLRVHVASEHHPVIGDRKYKASHDFGRLFLHSFRLILKHPAVKEMRVFTAPLPDDLKEYLRSAGIKSPDQSIEEACDEIIQEETVQDSISRA